MGLLLAALLGILMEELVVNGNLLLGKATWLLCLEPP